MMNNYLQDNSGNKSSKRLWGSIMLICAIVFSAILFYISLTQGAKDSVTAAGIINMFFYCGGGLLGIGTAIEKIKIPKRK